MRNAIFEEDEQEVDVAIHRPEKVKDETKSESEIASWLTKHKFAKDEESGKYRTIIIAILIFFVAAVIFVYGIGKREANNLEETGNVYLENER